MPLMTSLAGGLSTIIPEPPNPEPTVFTRVCGAVRKSLLCRPTPRCNHACIHAWPSLAHPCMRRHCMAPAAAPGSCAWTANDRVQSVGWGPQCTAAAAALCLQHGTARQHGHQPAWVSRMANQAATTATWERQAAQHDMLLRTQGPSPSTSSHYVMGRNWAHAHTLVIILATRTRTHLAGEKDATSQQRVGQRWNGDKEGPILWGRKRGRPHGRTG